MAREDVACLDLEAFYKTTPPPFGHGLRKFFGFDPRYTNMNNGKFAPHVSTKRLTTPGSYGALPTPVRKFCDDLTTDIEANPDKFYRLYAPERMREARTRREDDRCRARGVCLRNQCVHGHHNHPAKL